MMATRPGLWGIETEAQQLASLIARTLPVTVASVALWDEPSLSLTVKAMETVRPVGGSLPVGARVQLADAAWHRHAFEHNEPVLLEGTGASGLAVERESELALIPHVQSMYLVPIRFADETVGVLVLGEARGTDRERFSSEKQRQCQTILDEFVVQTAHAWEARRLRRQVRAMSSLMQLVRGVSTATSYDDLLGSLAAEVADWLGIPVRGALLGVMGKEIHLLAGWQLPDEILSDGGRQMFLAMTRSGARGSGPVTLAIAGDDPLDPIASCEPAAKRWTRVGVPLMRDDELVGVVCLYLEDEIRLADWELEALRRRGEILALGLESIAAAHSRQAEQEQLHRVAFDLLTGYRCALLREVFGSMTRTLAGSLERRLREALPGLVEQGQGAATGQADHGDLVTTIVADMSAAVSELWELEDTAQSVTMSLDVNDIVDRALRIVKTSLEDLSRRRGVTVVVRRDPAGQPVVVRGSLVLVGALVHAIESAVEAMSDGGEVQIRTGRENGHAVISVEDTGGQTLREPDSAPLARLSVRHPSVVLSLVRSIVHPFGGRVALQPLEASGSALVLHLPILSSGGTKD